MQSLKRRNSVRPLLASAALVLPKAIIENKLDLVEEEISSDTHRVSPQKVNDDGRQVVTEDLSSHFIKLDSF